ncbi:hypothetical protein PROFUN_00754 [Planoprotostelium fungivorum]|uniref:Uncharacterized protein n=1 Tax=Planoprotostelium fungivorum TaxID=1890364 RepID=A0A2P6NU97_9EUKA|nr:hypothetical protein PROFUN_00754 [Planoprotostelium fungivorum]
MVVLLLEVENSAQSSIEQHYIVGVLKEIDLRYTAGRIRNLWGSFCGPWLRQSGRNIQAL